MTSTIVMVWCCFLFFKIKSMFNHGIRTLRKYTHTHTHRKYVKSEFEITFDSLFNHHFFLCLIDVIQFPIHQIVKLYSVAEEGTSREHQINFTVI